jgi:predicted alpha/beta-fold hydrolase
VLVKYLGEEKERTPLTAAISVGNPFDIVKCSDNIDGTLFNRLTYSKALGQGLVDLFFNRSNAHEVFRGYPGIDVDALRHVKTVAEFDALFTIKHFKYGSVEEFYRDGSSITRLPTVAIPLLCLNAEDDPISVATGLPTREQVEANPNVILCTTKSGGHLAFYEDVESDHAEASSPSGTDDARGRLPVWSVKVIAEFAEAARVERKRHEE